MKSLKKWMYRKWSIERTIRKCSRGYYAIIESGYLMGFGREKR